MTSERRLPRLVAVLGVLAVAVAACGQGEAEPMGLPVNDDPGSTPPAAAGACLEGEPDCNDLGPLPTDDEPGSLPAPQDLPPPVDPGVPSGMVVDGGLTVSDALAGGVTGVIAVKGYLLDDGSGWRLCEVLAESFPPQCGGESLGITGHEEMVDVPMLNEQGVTWTDAMVTFLGEIVDGVLVVDPTVSG